MIPLGTIKGNPLSAFVATAKIFFKSNNAFCLKHFLCEYIK
jgi:hypothetical protein